MKIRYILASLMVAVNLWAQEIDIYTENYPPFNMKENNKLTGISVDILEEILKKTGSTQTLKDVKLTNWSRAYSIAQKKKNSMVFSTTRTKSRENLFKWVGPITETTIGVLAPKEKHIVINSAAELNRYKIGTVLKDIGELLLLEAGVEKKHIQSVSGENAIELSFNKMKNNRIDMFAYDITVANTNAKKAGIDVDRYENVYSLKKGELYYAFNPETDDKTIEKWQKALEEIKNDGTYKKILNRY